MRNFARAAYEAKTDVLDARVLSRYGEVFQLAVGFPAEASQGTSGSEQSPGEGPAWRRAQVPERHIEWLGEEIALMDEEYRKALSESAHLSETAALYQSVPGVGELTAASLVAYLPELGMCEGKALTALVGLAPWSRDSGGQRGYGLSAAAVVQCVACCTCRRCRRYATTRRWDAITAVCGSGGRLGRWRW